MTRIQITLGVLTVVVAVATTGCDDDKKTYNCESAMEAMYDDGCELWCSYDSSSIYLDTCGWYDDNDPANFSQNDAETVCENLEEAADDEDCKGDFKSLMNCLGRNSNDDCADGCEDPFEDLLECIF